MRLLAAGRMVQHERGRDAWRRTAYSVASISRDMATRCAARDAARERRQQHRCEPSDRAVKGGLIRQRAARLATYVDARAES
eukprot:365800-Chlamydomonas_euryale.AAC.27